MEQQNEPQPLTFATIEALQQWLLAEEIDVTQWGQLGSKTIDHLWRELEAGDAQLFANPPRRTVEAVLVLMREATTILVEVEQEFASGRTRQRNRPPGEKMKAGEHFRDAALRCLAEEMNVPQEQVSVDEASHELRQIEREGLSYPTLNTIYRFHVVEARVAGLPKRPFATHNQDEGTGGDPIRLHRWAWLPAEGSLAEFRVVR